MNQSTINMFMLWANKYNYFVNFPSILGSALVIMGLYFLLWGKSKEAQLSNGVKPNEEHVEQPPVQVQTV